MLIYEVNAQGPLELKEAYGELVKSHIKILLQQEGFTRAEWYERSFEDEGSNEEGFLWTIHYHVRDRVSLEKYIAGPGQRLRIEARQRFGDRMQVKRRILTLLTSV